MNDVWVLGGILLLGGLQTPIASPPKERGFPVYAPQLYSISTRDPFCRRDGANRDLSEVINYLEISQPRTMQISEVMCRLVRGRALDRLVAVEAGEVYAWRRGTTGAV